MKAFAAYYHEKNKRVQFKKVEQELAPLGEREIFLLKLRRYRSIQSIIKLQMA